MTMNVVRGARSPGLQRLSLAESWVTCFPARVTLQARACVPASHQAAPFTLVFARRPCSSIGKTRLRQPARCAPLQRDGISVNLFDNLLVDIIKAIIRNILNGIIFLLEQPKEQQHLEFPTFQSADAKMERESSNSQASETKSDKYSSNMTHAMGAVLTYRHELGMNYNFVLPDLIVGSCLQTPSDVDRLKQMGVKTIFCLQQDPDLEYFGVDICAIQARAKEIRGIEHIRAQIRDFDSFDLRKRLPVVVATLYTAVQRNRGIAYIHCTAGLGRAPAVALTYMHWLLGYDLLDANEMLLSVRPCFPKLEAIRNATCDLLTGAAKEQIQLKWPDSDCQSVEISGLDVGWGQMVPLVFAPKEKQWILNRELLVGKYEYKYVVDGLWTTNPREPLTQPNKDGHINNFVEVIGKFEDAKTKSLRRRLMLDNPELTDIDRKIIRRKLLSLPLD